MEEKTIRLDEINLHGLFTTVLKNLWVVVALCISAVLCFTSVSRLTYTPRYTSTATFMVSARDSTSAYNSLTTTQSMASVFVEVFQSNVLRDKIAQQMPDGKFGGAISTTTIPETNLLLVTVTDDQPDDAFRGLNLLIENYPSISDYLFSNAQLEVIKDPAVPVAPSNPLNVRSRYPLVVLAAGFVGVLAILAIYVFRDTVKTPKAARRKLDARLLRIIDHEQKNKTLRAKLRRRNNAPLITNALITKAFIEDNLSLCSALEYHARKRGQKVIVVTSVGENEGKSTVAANLALAMGEKGRTVALLDFDFRKPSLHKIFELPQDQGRTVTDYLLSNGADPARCLQKSKKHDILLGISRGGSKNITRLINSPQMAALLDYLRQTVDYVILDTPPMLAAADAESIAALADTALLVVRADYMPTASINEGLDRLRKSGPDVCGYALNNYHKHLI